MHLGIAEVAELPLAAALVDASGDVIARTPEWDGTGIGAVAYPVRSARLVVRTLPASRDCDELLTRLLGAIDSAAASLPGTQGGRVRMLGASLRLVAGRDATGRGPTSEVLELARAGITARTALTVETGPGSPDVVPAPEVVALVLVQLAVNAERHDAAEAVRLEVDRTTFRVVWRRPGAPPEVATSRRRAERRRWGMGFARIAADAVGGMVYPPRPAGDGTVAATFELGIRRLALPVAAVAGRRVTRATRSWDEETGLPPGSRAVSGSRLGALLAAAGAVPGTVIRDAGWAARTGSRSTWLAVPPDDAALRAADVVAGLAHERALSDHIPEPLRSTIGALTLLLGTVLGQPMPRVPIAVWRRRMAELAPAFGIEWPVPAFAGVGAIDPQVVSLLATYGAGFEIDGDRLWLRIRPECRDEPPVRVLLRPGEDRIPLG